MSIEVHQLTKIYGAQKAVDHISFQIQPGEIVGFLGPNGAGKSTTMKMLTTYISPSSGSATVAGYDIRKDKMEIKKSVGYLPESNPLYFDMYVKEYLSFAARIHHLPQIASRVSEVIELTGLTKEVKKKIGTLSKGYKQRVGIAQAIIHDPKVLILDEPTSGLDPNQIEEIRSLITNIGKDKSVMLSTHIMQEVEAMCSRIIIINDGRIVQQLDLQETVQEKGVPRLHTIQVIFTRDVDVRDVRQSIGEPSFQIHQRTPKEILISSEQPGIAKKRIMEYALSANLEISSLKEHQEDLAAIFKSATNKGKHNP